MAGASVLYISAAADMAAEREILGRAITEVPVDLPWRIVQSPAGNGPLDLEAVVNADIHIVVMGGDIRAPIGLEWQIARQYGRRPVAFLKNEVLHTPAGRDFIRLVRETQAWIPFDNGTALRREVLRMIGTHIFDHAGAYALTPPEIARLRRWAASLEEAASPDEVVDDRRGAGDSAILLSRDRFEPSDGVILEAER